MVSSQTSFKAAGYVVLPKLFSRDELLRLQDIADTHFPENIQNAAFIFNMLERNSSTVWPLVSRPALLDILETIIGPFVQLDSVVLQSTEAAETHRVTGWHRDRFAGFPSENTYTKPLTVNLLVYLQDVTDETGPLRILTGTHRKAETIDPTQMYKGHDKERLLFPHAGDGVLIHNRLIHSGTRPQVGLQRRFFGVAFNHTFMKQEDDFSGPNSAQLLQSAEASDDHRRMRLLGEDRFLEARLNTGFLRPDEELWDAWIKEERR